MKEGALPSLHLGRKESSERKRKLPASRNVQQNSEVQNYKKRKNEEPKNRLSEDEAELLIGKDNTNISLQNKTNIPSMENESDPSATTPNPTIPDIQSNPVTSESEPNPTTPATESNSMSNPVTSEFESNSMVSESQSNPMTSATESNSSTLFKKILEKNVQMPASWIRSSVSWGNEHGIAFVKLIGMKGKNGLLDSAFHKKITIDENLLMNISINGKNVNQSDLGINCEKIQSVKNLEEILLIIDKKKICFGSTNIDMNESNTSLLRTFCYVDGIGTLRNNNCSILLPEETETNTRQCRFCNSISQVLNKKIIRHQVGKRKYVQLKKISPKKREEFIKLRQKMRNANRAKEKAKTKNRLLKRTLDDCKKEIEELTETSVTKILSEQSKISENERTAIKEIFMSANCKNPNARRYSDEWVVLCLLLHMKSPATYRFILENEILPVPAVRTIRRYIF